MKLDINKTKELLAKFDFQALFVEVLGWSNPVNKRPFDEEVKGIRYSRKEIAQLGGVVVFEVTTADGKIPNKTTCLAIQSTISKKVHENLLVFLDKERTQSLWFWIKRENGKKIPRDQSYFKGQPGDLFISKISSMHFDMGDLDESGNASILEVTGCIKKALDVEKITKKFYREFYDQHIQFLQLIKGIAGERDKGWYASILLNRLMFIYFLQRKGFIDNRNLHYLRTKLEQSKKEGKNLYFEKFLKILFFEGFAKPEEERSPHAKKLLGKIRYLNGGLFLQHRIELENLKIIIPDEAFENLLGLFERYSWNLNDTPGGEDNEINPDVLGYIFEKYINQKAFGAYYTRPEITEYLSERTIHEHILKKIGESGRQFESIAELLMNLDAKLCRGLLALLPEITILDPACGSGAFLVAAMRTLINIYSAVVGKIQFLADNNLNLWLKKLRSDHKSIHYSIKKKIITDNLFGVDIMEEATEIAKLRLFLALVASAQSEEELEPLPNIDFNIQTGNSLIGLLHVEGQAFDERQRQGDLFRKSYRQILEEKNRMIDSYRHAAKLADDLRSLRDGIEQKKKESAIVLNEILLSEFSRLGIKYEEVTWDEKKNCEGRSKKRALRIGDIQALQPFHWGFEFDEILQKGGFDIILTNPPWEIFKPIAKEFCYEFDPEIERRGTDIKDFEERLGKLLVDKGIRQKFLAYLNRFPHVSGFYRSATQYKNQISIVNGKKAGSDTNLYKLFTEQCFNLLRPQGYCGIVIPSGIYSDLGTKQLREMLFTQSKITGLFCFENRKEIFEGVHRSFKFLVLTFEKGGVTKNFPAAFMRHEVTELERFPQEGAISISIDLVRRLSPDSLSVMEFKSPTDVTIAEKMLKFPLLGEKISGKWNLRLTAEFHMTNDSHLFKTSPGNGCLPLYEGKMIWHFECGRESPRYWVNEKDVRDKLKAPVPFEHYRLGFRAVTGATNERALVVSAIPRYVCAGNSLIVSMPTASSQPAYSPSQLLVMISLLGSFVCDWYIRQKILTNMNMFYVYEIPVPRLAEKDVPFWPIVQRAAKLICTTPEFDGLAKEVGLKSYKNGVTNSIERAKLRAELDAIIAHLYGLTEEEFGHILATFPIVPQPVKDAALQAYRDLAPKSGDQQVADLVAQGESATLELKSSVRWNMKESK